MEVDPAPAASDNHYPKVARRIAEEKAKTESNGAIWANQFDNVANRQGHIDTTAPEIWRDTDGRVDGFICAVGSGGTLGGVSMGLKAKNRQIVIGLADPGGAALFNWYKNGELKAEGNSITEGIGQGRITANLEGVAVDEAYRIEDRDWLPVLYNLVQEEGLCVGGSSALNVLGAIRAGERPGAGQDHRHCALRLRQSLYLQALQSRLPAVERSADPALARVTAGRSGKQGCGQDAGLCLTGRIGLSPRAWVGFLRETSSRRIRCKRSGSMAVPTAAIA